MTKKVLIVEDDEKLNKMLRFIFNAKGFEVSSASDGKNAIELLENTAPDVIILDLMMPGMDGFQLIDWLDGDKMMKSTPRIILSSMPYSEDIEKKVSTGATDFIGKPFKSAELFGKVSEMMKMVS